MNPIITGKLRQIGGFCLLGIIAGIIFQLLHEGIVDFRAVLIGVSLGGAFGIIEFFVLSGFRKRLLKLPHFITIITKAFAYLLIINLVSGLLMLISGILQGKQMEDFYSTMLSKEQLILNIYTLTLYALLSFFVQINLLLGEGVLLKFLMGKYRKPIGENRIFMFLDLKSSTTLAERLGLENYYSLLNDFFHDISEPVLATNAEIYQYVGDEVVFTWKTNEGLANSNCLKIFFKIRERVYNNRKYYRDKYGDIPHFKAGIHFGEVISAQIGDIKREIIYNGDVLNTSSRIQEQCNKYNRELLISGLLLKELDIKNEFRAEKLDTVKLRGKESSMELFSLMQF
jgi:adenylate cyclase